MFGDDEKKERNMNTTRYIHHKTRDDKDTRCQDDKRRELPLALGY